MYVYIYIYILYIHICTYICKVWGSLLEKGTCQAGWVARGSELGARGPDGWHAGARWAGLVAHGSELGACGPGGWHADRSLNRSARRPNLQYWEPRWHIISKQPYDLCINPDAKGSRSHLLWMYVFIYVCDIPQAKAKAAAAETKAAPAAEATHQKQQQLQRPKQKQHRRAYLPRGTRRATLRCSRSRLSRPRTGRFDPFRAALLPGVGVLAKKSRCIRFRMKV